MAANTLGYLRQNRDEVLTNLIQTASSDPNYVVRMSAIKAVGQFGTNAIVVKSQLDAIAAMDESVAVRNHADKTSRAVIGGK